MNVAKSEVDKYGVIKGNFLKSKISKVTALVEKPKSQDAPSNLAVVGRYVLKKFYIQIPCQNYKRHRK